MRIERAINLEDLRHAAERALPKLAFDFIDGGVEDEIGMALNRSAFERYRLVPRYLVNVKELRPAATLFGRDYAMPVGVSPMGMMSMFRRDADLMIAAAAAKANIPFIMSSASSASVEQAAAIAPDHLWFQIYGSLKREITFDLIRRARELKLRTLVLTVDVPVGSKRERNLRNGFTRPLRLTRRAVFDVLRHPAWLYAYLRNGGLPLLGNLAPYAAKGASADDVAALFASQTPAADQVWDDLVAYRRAWPGNLVIKGILHPQDAVLARQAGVDAIMVSNHGGRQLDRAPSALEMLMPIRAAIGEGLPLLIDGGIRRGADILTARALGADFCFIGRPAIFGAAAAGMAGAQRAIDILLAELQTTMAQIGIASLDALEPSQLLDSVTGAPIAVRTTDRMASASPALAS